MRKLSLNKFWLAGIFLLSWAGYLKTLCPTLYVGDTGELISSGYVLGIPHPPGYPLYVLLGRLFSLLPLGEIAFRFNLLSAFFTAASIAGLAYYLRLLFSNLASSTALAFMWAWGRTQWEMASTAEVYQVENCLFLLLLLALYYYKKTSQKSYLYLAVLIFGLGLSAHYSFLLFLPAILLYLYSASLFKKTLKNLPLVITFGLLGWLTFAHLPLRAVNQPLVNWGNCLNFTNYLNHLRRTEYQEVAISRSWQQFGQQIYYLGLFISQELPLFSGFLGLGGIIILYLKYRPEFWLTAGISLVMIFVGGYFLNYDSLSRALGFGPKFFLPFYVILLIFLGASLSWLINKTSRYRRYFYVLTLILLLSSLAYSFSQNSYRLHRLASYLGKDILVSLPKQASLMVEEEDNELFILTYMQNVLSKRADVKIFDPYANLFPQSYQPYFNMLKRRPPDRYYREQIEKWVVQDKNLPPVFYTVKPSLNAPYKPAGLLYTPSQNSSFALPSLWKYYHPKNWEKVPLNYWSRYLVFSYSLHLGENLLKVKREKAAMKILFSAYNQVRGIQWLAFNLGVVFQENGLYPQAVAAYKEELNLGIVNREAWINLGLVYSQLNLLPQALLAFERAASIKEDAPLLRAKADIFNRLGN